MKLYKAVVVGAVSAALLLTGGTTASAETREGVKSHSAPTKIRVGAPTMEVPVTVIAHGPGKVMNVDLFTPSGRITIDEYQMGDEPGRPGVFKFYPELHDWQITSWGRWRWDFHGYRWDDTGHYVHIEDEAYVDVRAHSMLGLGTSRSGSTIALKGSLRAYHNVESRYVAWSGRPISVQRWTGSSWVQVTGARTNTQGDINLRLNLPTGTPLRLVAGDTGGTWGATSQTVTR